MDAIFNRRSIRRYTSEPVPEEAVDRILRAGMAAPSAGDERPWHFIVLRDRAVLDAIPRFHPYAQMLRNANCAIVVCGDPTEEKFDGYWVQDCSAATENMLLMAQGLGLGSVWLGVYPMQDRVAAMRELLGAPQAIIPFCIVSLGYAIEPKAPANRYHPERIHRDRW